MQPTLIRLATLSTFCICTNLLAHTGSHVYKSAPLLVTIPSFVSAKELNASLLFLQPNSSSVDYAVMMDYSGMSLPNWEVKTLDPHLDAGFNLGFIYTFDNTANDISIDWTHLNSRRENAENVGNLQYIAPLYNFGSNNKLYSQADGKVNFNYDVANVEIGQFVNFGHHLQTRFFIGGNFLRIKRNVTASFAGTTSSLATQTLSDFKGWGPRFGVAGSYDFTKGWGVIAQVAGTASVGKIHSEENVLTQSVSFPYANQTLSVESNTRVVPGGDAKIGLTYAYPLDKVRWLKCEAGYQVAAYMNAVKDLYFGAGVSSPILASPAVGGISSLSEDQNNFSVSGPYLKAAIKG